MEFIASLFTCQFYDTTAVSNDDNDHPDYFNFGGDDVALNRCFRVLNRRHATRGIAALCCQCIVVFQKAKYNRDASRAASELIRNVVAFFGDPNVGLMALCSKNGLDFPAEEDKTIIDELENVLNRTLRYFSRFTVDTSADYLLVGKEPQHHFVELYMKLSRSVQLAAENSRLSPEEQKELPKIIQPMFFVVCNFIKVLRQHDMVITKLKRGRLPSSTQDIRETYLSKMASDRGLPSVTEELREEVATLVDSCRRSAQRIGSEASQLIASSSPSHVIAQFAMLEFWCSSILPRHELPLTEFVRILQQQLTTMNVSVAEASRLTHAMRTAILRTDLSAQTSIMVDAVCVGKLVRFINSDLSDLVEVMTILAIMTEKNIRWCVPSFPSWIKEVHFARGEKSRMIEALTTPGISAIVGPSGIGKTTRLLSIIHSNVLPSRDIVWIDLDRVYSDSAGLARVARQLSLLHCTSISDLMAELKQYLLGLRPAGSIVVDNVELLPAFQNPRATCFNPVNERENSRLSVSSRWKVFLRQLFAVLQEFVDTRNFSLVLASRSSPGCNELVDIGNEIVVEPLSKEAATTMIERLKSRFNKECPLVMVDIPAMLSASARVPGVIAAFADWPSLKIARQLGSEMDIAHNDQGRIIEARCHAARMLFQNLSFDEKLLACCLYSHVSYFSGGMTWEMSKEVFGNDMIRWKLAWSGLISVGWIIRNPELGYCLSFIAELVQPSTALISEQELYDNYVLYWASEVIRVDQLSCHNKTILEYFGANMPHIHHVFANIFAARSSNRGTESDESHEVGATVISKTVGDSDQPPLPSARSEESNRSRRDASPGSARRIKSTYSNITLQSSLDKLSRTHTMVPTLPLYADGIFRQPKGNSDKLANDLDPQEDIRANHFVSVIRSHKARRFLHVEYDDQFYSVGVSVGISHGTHPDIEFKVYNLFKETSSKQKRLHPPVSRVSRPVLKAMTQELVGCISNILSYFFTPRAAVSVAKAFVSQLNPADGLPYHLSELELAEQYLRNDEFENGLAVISPVLATYYSFDSNELLKATTINPVLPPYFARALVAYGKLKVLSSSGRTGSRTTQQNAGLRALTVAAEISGREGLEADKRFILELKADLEAAIESSHRGAVWNPMSSDKKRTSQAK